MFQTLVSEGRRGFVVSPRQPIPNGLHRPTPGPQPVVSAGHVKDGIAEMREQTRNRHLDMVRGCQSNRIR